MSALWFARCIPLGCALPCVLAGCSRPSGVHGLGAPLFIKIREARLFIHKQRNENAKGRDYQAVQHNLRLSSPLFSFQRGASSRLVVKFTKDRIHKRRNCSCCIESRLPQLSDRHKARADRNHTTILSRS